jgi:hypothetical protein
LKDIAPLGGYQAARALTRSIQPKGEIVSRFMMPKSFFIPNRERCIPCTPWAAFLALAVLLALSGCAPLQVRLGRKIYLDQTPIASMTATLPNGPGIAPGQKSPLIAAFTEPGGEVLTTEGAGKRKVLWKDITIATTVVTANQKGTLTLPADPRVSEGKQGHVVLTVPSHPDLHAELDVPVRYDYNFSAIFPAALARAVSTVVMEPME